MRGGSDMERGVTGVHDLVDLGAAELCSCLR